MPKHEDPEIEDRAQEIVAAFAVEKMLEALKPFLDDDDFDQIELAKAMARVVASVSREQKSQYDWLAKFFVLVGSYVVDDEIEDAEDGVGG